MSENYSNEMFDLVDRTRKILNLARNLYSEEGFKTFKARAHNNVVNHVIDIKDDLDLAKTITFGGLTYTENGVVRNEAITNVLLAKQIETAYGVKSEFMKRDSEKQITLYEMFANDYFGKMFGEKGYRQLFEGNGKEFTEDFKKYGASEEDVERLDKALDNSIKTGEYNPNDNKFAFDLCTRVSENRRKLEGKRIMSATELWEEAAYANPEIEVTPKKKTL